MTERYITVKDQTDLPASIKPLVSFQMMGNNVEAVVVKVGEDFIRIVKNGSYSETLKVLKSQPLKEVTKYKLSGLFMGLTQVEEEFDTEAEAEERKNEYSRKINWDDTSLEITEIKKLVANTSL